MYLNYIKHFKQSKMIAFTTNNKQPNIKKKDRCGLLVSWFVTMGAKCWLHNVWMFSTIHVGFIQSFMPVFKHLCLHWKMSFAEIIVEGPTFQPLETLKNRSSGPTIGDSWLEEIWVLIQKFRRCSLSSVPPEVSKHVWMLAKFG